MSFINGIATGGLIVCIISAITVGGIALIRYLEDRPDIAPGLQIGPALAWITGAFILFCGLASL